MFIHANQLNVSRYGLLCVEILLMSCFYLQVNLPITWATLIFVHYLEEVIDGACCVFDEDFCECV